MAKFREYDIVALAKPVSHDGVSVGDVGTVLIVHDATPPAYEVEFCDDAGVTVALLTLEEEYMAPYDNGASGASGDSH